MRGQGCTKLCCEKIKNKKLFADAARDSHAPAGPHPPLLQLPDTACGYMSQQSGGAFSLPWRFGLCVSNRPARSLRGPFVGIGGLGFAFRLAQHERACVTIAPKRPNQARTRSVFGSFGRFGSWCFNCTQNGGGVAPPFAPALQPYYLYNTHTFKYQETIKPYPNSQRLIYPLDIAHAFTPFFWAFCQAPMTIPRQNSQSLANITNS